LWKECRDHADRHAPDAEAVQLDLMRRATPRQRFELMRSLTSLAFFSARRAIARANPGATQEELDVIFADVHYGPQIAEQLREFFKSRAGR
jgi:hypothetical protein